MDRTLWWDSLTTRLYVRYNDGSSTQWVQAAASTVDLDLTSVVAKTGDTMTGALVLYGPPTADLQAATKKYVDDSGAAAATIENYLSGYNTANDTTDATNDIVIDRGICADSTNARMIRVVTQMIKQLDVAWAPGNNAGGRMSLAGIADTTYHLHAIVNPSSGAADFGFDVSPTAPTLPTGFTHFRRIASIKREAGAIRLYYQDGDLFQWRSMATDRNSASAVAWSLLALTLPLGIRVQPIVNQYLVTSAVTTDISVEVGDARDTTRANPQYLIWSKFGSEANYGSVTGGFYSNTSGQISFRVVVTAGAPGNCVTQTRGYIDTRGK